MAAANDTLSDDDLGSERPTVPPPTLASVVRYKTGAPVDELLYRLAMGDCTGALDSAQDLFDHGRIPVRSMPDFALSDIVLGYREELLLAFIDGNTALKEVIQATGLEMLDALRALCELLEKDVVLLC